ncbi:TPA: type II toxin-antitoxin system RelB/DinJ family antitoxin [Pasteurella multocida]|nr:type II toxin-antitoxin system RelB/DinJ family antitoxin [Pasteurella multocida]HDX1177484.1 type II toxin-antitoxin system RelB/DinJ family antitoxin [Pasteurella multocida]
MSKQKDLVKAIIDLELKEKAVITAQEMGLTISDIIRLTLIYVVENKELPIKIRDYSSQKDTGK